METAHRSYDCRDRGHMDELYKQLRPYALKKCHYILGDVAQSQDLVQDVFMRLWDAGMVFPDIESAYKWVYRCCHNAAIDRVRRVKVQYEFTVEQLVFLTPEVMTPQDRVANRQLVERILPHFSEREAEILAYIAIDRLSHREIAELLNISIKTVQRTVGTIDQKIAKLRRGL